jgi:hypothetical protein
MRLWIYYMDMQVCYKSAATRTTKFVRSVYDVKHASLIAGLGKISAAQLHIVAKSDGFYRT